MRVGDVGVDALRGDAVPLAPAGEQQPQRRAQQRPAARAASPRARTRRSGTGCGSSRRGRRRDRRARRAPRRSRRRRRRSRAGRATRSRAGRAAAAAGTCARSAAAAAGTTSADGGPRSAPRCPLVVDGGEDVGLRPGVADRREDALGAAKVEQEVVDECDTRHRARVYVADARAARGGTRRAFVCWKTRRMRPLRLLCARPRPPATAGRSAGAARLARRGRRRPADLGRGDGRRVGPDGRQRRGRADRVLLAERPADRPRRRTSPHPTASCCRPRARLGCCRS